MDMNIEVKLEASITEYEEFLESRVWKDILQSLRARKANLLSQFITCRKEELEELQGMYKEACIMEILPISLCQDVKDNLLKKKQKEEEKE